MHRDIKPENILIEDIDKYDDIHIKLADFGHADVLELDAKFSYKLKSEHYLAPEVIKGELYDEKIDVWSATICVYIMLNEYLPFNGIDKKEIQNQIMTHEIDFEDPMYNHLSWTAKSFLKMGMQKSPNQRSNSRKMFNHPWMYEEDSPQFEVAVMSLMSESSTSW